MRRRHAAAGIAAILIASLGVSDVLALSPSPAQPDWVQEGTSRTYDLADGARVHAFSPRTDRTAHQAPAGPLAATLAGYGIDYHGGPVVPAESVVSIYWSSSTIYAGGPVPGTTGAGSADGSLVGYFLNHLGGSPYYAINTTYADTVGSGHTVANGLAYTQYWADTGGAPSGSQVVSDASIQAEITKGLTSGAIPWDPSTVYAVFSSGSVNLGGQFLSSYCAYHGSFTWGSNTVLYAVMPYDQAGPGVCTALAAPNGDAAGDAEVNTLAHELEEANTDPQLNAWWNSQTGAENADQCAWNFGTQSLSNGQANITVGARNFLVQQNWVNASGRGCAQSYGPSAPTVPATPSLTSATAGSASIALSWSTPGSGGSPILGYDVFRATSSGSEGTTPYVPYTTVGTATSYTDAGVTAGVTYYYEVRAVNAVGPGALSNERSATPGVTAAVPGAPVLTAATASSRRGVQLSWTVPAANGNPLTAYDIYRGTSATNLTRLTQRGTSSTTYRDTNTSSGVVYYYAVTAVNAVGEGPRSNIASAKAR